MHVASVLQIPETLFRYSLLDVLQMLHRLLLWRLELALCFWSVGERRGVVD